MSKEILSTQQEFSKKIDRMNNLMEKRVSLGWNFLLGIVTGVGSVIGFTIIGGILLAILAASLDRINSLPMIERFVNLGEVERIIDPDSRR